jgi:hypothetical protein
MDRRISGLGYVFGTELHHALAILPPVSMVPLVIILAVMFGMKISGVLWRKMPLDSPYRHFPVARGVNGVVMSGISVHFSESRNSLRVLRPPGNFFRKNSKRFAPFFLEDHLMVMKYTY